MKMEKMVLFSSVRVLQASLIIAAGLTMVSCDNGGGTSNSESTGFSMKVIDAKGSAVEGATVAVLADGDPDDVIAAKDETQTTDADGLAVFKASSKSKKIGLKAFKGGYFGNTTTATTATVSSSVNLILTKKESVDNAIRFSSKTGSAADGFTIQTGDEGEDKPFKAEITVPSGLKNEKGESIEDVVVEVAHYDSEEVVALSSFPGGFSAQIENPSAIDADAIGGASGSGNTVNFVSAGFVAVELKDKATGEKITQFDTSTPLKITMAIDPNAQFPLADGNTRKVVAGDIIPVWSYENDTGKWKYEGEGSVSTQDGQLVVTYNVTHLSYYNLDWWFWGGSDAQTCEATINVAQADGNPYPNDLDGMVYRVGGGWEHHFNHDANGSTSFPLLSAPKDINVTMTLTDVSTGQVVYTSGEFNLCNDAPITVSLPIVGTGTGTGSSGSGG